LSLTAKPRFKPLTEGDESCATNSRTSFHGASVIHSSQVAILNEEFAPAADEVASAKKIVAAYA
jgi:citrate lyase beta subunit